MRERDGGAHPHKDPQLRQRPTRAQGGAHQGLEVHRGLLPLRSVPQASTQARSRTLGRPNKDCSENS